MSDLRGPRENLKPVDRPEPTAEERDDLEAAQARWAAEAAHAVYLASLLQHAPGCPRVRPERRILGERANGDQVAELFCRQCEATLRLVNDEPERPDRARKPANLWAEPEWLAVVKAYQSCESARPSQLDVARQLGFDTEQPLRDRLRPLGITNWRAVHALIAARPRG
jgi:hypothetical protein